MSAGQRQMRSSMAGEASHFEQSYQELTAMKKGTVGRSANVQELLTGVTEALRLCSTKWHTDQLP